MKNILFKIRHVVVNQIGFSDSHDKQYVRAVKLHSKLKEFNGDLPRTLSYLRKIDPFLFEELILFCFYKANISVNRNRRYTGDGGIDGRISYNGKSILIQAKRYSSHINPEHVKELADLISKTGASGACFVHTGKTGALSYSEASQNKIIFISGQNLVNLIAHSQIPTKLLNLFAE